MNRIRELDGVRGVAILLVLIWHYYYLQVLAAPDSTSFAIRQWLGLSWSGVDLFFVLSGFLITGILLDNSGASNFFGAFYARRACRILPAYLLLLLSYFFVTAFWGQKLASCPWLLHEPNPLWSYLTFTQNFFMGASKSFGSLWLGTTWSLAIEEQFYLVLPLLVWLLPRRVLPFVFLALIVTAPILRWNGPGVNAFVGTPWRADSLITGALLAWCVRRPAVLQFLKVHQTKIYWVFALFVLGAGVINRFGPLKPLMVFEHLWLAGLYGLLVLIAFIHREGLLAKALRFPVFGWFGMLSFGIYLFHQPVSGLLHASIRGSQPRITNISDASITLLALVVTLLLAWLSYRFIERPFLDYGRRFQYAPEPQGAAPQIANIGFSPK